MIDLTIKSLALKINISVDTLIKQFADAGIYKSINDYVTQKEQETLLLYLDRIHGNTSSKLTLKRKIRTTLPGIGGKNKSIKIEIRKKHTYFKNQDFIEKTKIKVETQKPILKDILIKNNSEKIKLNKDKLVQEIKKEKTLIIKKTNKTNKKSRTDKNRLDIESIEFKRKSEENSRLKLEKEARKIAEEARRTSIDKKNDNWTEISEEIEDHYRYNTSVSKNIKPSENKNNQIENDKNIKIIKQKKKNKYTDNRNNKNKKRLNNNILQQIFCKPKKIVKKEIIIGNTINIADFSNKMAIKSSKVMNSMIKMGFSATTINQNIDQETAQLVAEELGHKVILKKENHLEESILIDRDIYSKLETRAPIVTIMGHVDHGKTSLLDCINSTKKALHEVGGITQHIGAYYIKTKNNNITFLDTPGHAAFNLMRMRGAQITDIVVLVIAADDGVMPQTLEAIKHAKLSKVPIIVAINKIDKIDSNIKHIKNELSKHEIISEEWGGENIFVEISAKTGYGIDNLLNSILIQAEIMDLKSTKLGMASGIVIESYLDKGRGPVANVLVREGTLKKNDIILCGLEHGKIRSMTNEFSKEINEAGPSMPVKIFGLSGIPIAGDKFTIVRNEKKAREVSIYRRRKFRETKLANQQKNKLEDIYYNMNLKNILDINIVLKTDVQGSLEAIYNTLLKLSNDKVKIKIIYSGVGTITETDVTLASAAEAMILGFNVRIDVTAKRIVDTLNLNFRNYTIIYNLIDEIKKIIDNLIEKKDCHDIIGKAEVKNIFQSPKFGIIAGCIVTEGVIKKNKIIKILRNDKLIYEGELTSLRRFKDDVNEVRNGIECGISVKNFNDIKNGDIIKSFKFIKK